MNKIHHSYSTNFDFEVAVMFAVHKKDTAVIFNSSNDRSITVKNGRIIL